MKKAMKHIIKGMLLARCEELGITVPEKATIKILNSFIDEYLSKAVVVMTSKGAEMRRTDEATKTYLIEYMISGHMSIEAVSEETAIDWVENVASASEIIEIAEETDAPNIEILNISVEGESEEV